MNPLCSRRRFLASIVASLAMPAALRLTPPAAAQNQEAFSVALDWYPNANHAGFFLARERGYTRKRGCSHQTPSDPTTACRRSAPGATRSASPIRPTPC